MVQYRNLWYLYRTETVLAQYRTVTYSAGPVQDVRIAIVNCLRTNQGFKDYNNKDPLNNYRIKILNSYKARLITYNGFGKHRTVTVLTLS